jgi:hypothetical protein
MTADLLALLAAAHPNASPEQLRLMLDNVPDRNIKPPQKAAGACSGSRPRTDASMERRRSWAASGRMPPRLACRFTLAEAAVLAVVADQVGKVEACELTLDHIAALAGVCRRVWRAGSHWRSRPCWLLWRIRFVAPAQQIPRAPSLILLAPRKLEPASSRWTTSQPSPACAAPASRTRSGKLRPLGLSGSRNGA